jgi:hypothetical protein
MKKMKLFVGMLAVAGLGFTSCSDDDSDSGNDNRIEGTYHLEEVNTAEATDFDEDGDSHIDQTEESDCYNDGKITLNDDNTMTYVATGILIDEENGTDGCIESTTLTGTWELIEGSGSDALIEITYEDENEESQTVTLTKMGNELIWDEDDIFSTYPDRNEEGGAIYTSGSTQYVFKK